MYSYWNDFGPGHWFNLNGQDIMFEPCEQAGAQSKLGDRHHLLCHRGELSLRVDFVVTSECRTEDEGCEHTSRDATLRIRTPDAQESVKLLGGCGC